jgi:hypothetical protein
MGEGARGGDMIELPHGFLNALFAAMIVVANINRSRKRSID